MFVEFYGAGLRRACRSPTGPRSATCLPSSARPARSSRSTPRRSATSSSPGARPSRSRWSRPTPARRACGTTRTPKQPTFSDTLELDLGDGRAEPRRPQAPPGPRLPERWPRSAFREALGGYVPDYGEQADPQMRPFAESYPASDPPANGTPGHAPPDGGPRLASQRPRRARVTRHGIGHRGERMRRTAELRARPRPRRDRGDHQLHQHLQPVGDDRGRDPRPQRRRPRPALQALGQDLACARLEGRHRVPRPRRAHRAARELGFNLVGYGCTTCIGNSGPLPRGDLRRRSARPIWRSSRCSRATATSRGASTRT